MATRLAGEMVLCASLFTKSLTNKPAQLPVRHDHREHERHQREQERDEKMPETLTKVKKVLREGEAEDQR